MSNSNQSTKLEPPKDLSHLLSHSVKARPLSEIKKFYKYFSIPNIAQLAGGLPAPSYFPFDTLEASIASPNRWVPSQKSFQETDAQLTSQIQKHANPSATHITVPKWSDVKDPNCKIDLATALQYGTTGYPALWSFMRSFTRNHLHPNVPYEGGVEIVPTAGNTEGFSKALEAFVNPWIPGKDPVELREALLVEKFAYPTAIQTARPYGMQVVPVAMDSEGMLAHGPEGLLDVLQRWDETKGKRPHVMYTVTVGQNPTGGVLSLERKKQVYQVCQQYDIIIVEDEPYSILQYPSSFSKSQTNSVAASRSYVDRGQARSSGYEFLDSLVPSYLAIDKDGRVVRLDTFSKTIAPGCRMGWMTIQPALADNLLRISQTSIQQPSGFVQSLVAKMIHRTSSEHGNHSSAKENHRDDLEEGGWDVSGWVRWLEGLRGEYERRMNIMCDILEAGRLFDESERPGLQPLTNSDETWEVLKTTSMYSFVKPQGGMFIWMRVHIEQHPCYAMIEAETLVHALFVYLTYQPYRILLFPGTSFGATEEIKRDEAWQFFRACFAAVDTHQLAPMSHRMVNGFQDFWKLDIERIRKIVNDDEASEVSGQTDGDVFNLCGFC